MAEKTAIVLFNLGGPDSLDAVKPFLFNLFFDKAIIRAPLPIRYLLAKLITSRRAPYTQEIYKKIGNQSPLLEWTRKQATALEEALNHANHQSPTTHHRVFITMRYWHPFSAETVKQVQAYAPDRIILLPLYPQFSTTTTQSSIEDLQRAAKRAGLNVPTATVCCYPTEPHFISAHVALMEQALAQLPTHEPYRILFSAHGLPQKVIDAGDPYQWQVEQTVAAIIEKLHPPSTTQHPFDHVICYQSRVGPLQWIGPSTEDEIMRAVTDGKSIILVPVAFVSEHSETLVELDMDYANQAKEQGIKHYIRVPALGIHPDFIASLASICTNNLQKLTGFPDRYVLCSTHTCPAHFKGCPRHAENYKGGQNGNIQQTGLFSR